MVFLALASIKPIRIISSWKVYWQRSILARLCTYTVIKIRSCAPSKSKLRACTMILECTHIENTKAHTGSSVAMQTLVLNINFKF